ncbi:NADPH:quinone reductase-like Zn-dependent oxidoreductase [Breoghania corrubedonensis]|uniref:NADPH:quinone reductase-like Zn-dependent oxidoreductase n=1 Tax=Breoghania corrubedonensis TaxID=665038 RepID=A0A2T5V939_9HYPH|nr:zinc-binding alcohol dehydrogenase family protein [Breoghania corrubedonensis]PTW60244.1 NADPH:quinone reductase-like Zn-dependent oxidoreductase [Breoghania corrubedonensis]
MKAAVVHSAGNLPVWDEFAAPEVGAGEIRVRVRAAAISQLARARAAGKHYSSRDNHPFVAGVDGVGMCEDGRRVYFANPRPPQGSMAEEVAVAVGHCVPVPDDLDDVTAAALANPGMSSWMALRERADLQPGETVLINGATGSSGALAVQIARHFGAGRIIATGRNPQALDELRETGVDETISLNMDEADQKSAFEAAFGQGVDVVLDYLWGASAGMILHATAKIPDPARSLRFVQIGSMTGDEIALPAALLRSRDTVLMGSGIGSVAFDRMATSVRDLLAAASTAGFRIETETAPLSQVESAWSADTGNRRLVLTL